MGFTTLLVHNNSLGGNIEVDLFNSSAYLKSLLLHSNTFDGKVDFLEMLPEKTLEEVSLDSNNFVGNLPTRLFNSSSLRVFSAGNNCFEGGLGGHICKAKNLEILAVPAATSGKGCRNSIWSHAPAFLQDRWNAFLVTHWLEGSVPECIFNDLNLSLIILGGNRLSGDISHWNIPRP